MASFNIKFVFFFSSMQCGANIIFFGRRNIQIYSLSRILDKWMSKYIQHDKKDHEWISKQIWSKKINKYFGKWIYSFKIYKHIWIFFVQGCFGLFWPFSYFMLFLAQIKPFWTNNNDFYHFWETMKIQIYSLP